MTQLCSGCEQGQESAEMQPKAVKALLQAAHSGTSDFLNAQWNLVKSQGASGPRALSASTTAASTAWDPAALGAVTGIAQPLIADILGQTDLTHHQRVNALQEAKESMTARLVKKGIFRNQV